jgi:mRNA interferase RelE/StbE
LRLSAELQRRLASVIDALAVEPRPHGCEKMVGGEDWYRVRVGDYRVVCQVESRRVLVLVIAHRRVVYRRGKR